MYITVHGHEYMFRTRCYYLPSKVHSLHDKNEQIMLVVTYFSHKIKNNRNNVTLSEAPL